MKTTKVTVVRIYLTEADKELTRLIKYLQDEVGIRGFTVFRALSGLGSDKSLHSSALVDLSLDLPVVLEFFDESAKVTGILDHLAAELKPKHMIYWDANSNG